MSDTNFWEFNIPAVREEVAHVQFGVPLLFWVSEIPPPSSAQLSLNLSWVRGAVLHLAGQSPCPGMASCGSDNTLPISRAPGHTPGTSYGHVST